MLEEFSLAEIIKGCFRSGKFKSPECRLLKRISDGDDVPEYPEYKPEKRYFVQISDKVFGPTEPYMYETMDELVDEYTATHGEYPYDIWTEE
jgi:hypothetical protein